MVPALETEHVITERTDKVHLDLAKGSSNIAGSRECTIRQLAGNGGNCSELRHMRRHGRHLGVCRSVHRAPGLSCSGSSSHSNRAVVRARTVDVVVIGGTRSCGPRVVDVGTLVKDRIRVGLHSRRHHVAKGIGGRLTCIDVALGDRRSRCNRIVTKTCRQECCVADNSRCGPIEDIHRSISDWSKARVTVTHRQRRRV